MINVTKSYLPNEDKYHEYVSKIFASGRLTNHGDLVQELEKRLGDYLGVNNLVLVSNGTLALQIAYKLLNLSGEVITTPFSFIATASSIFWEGCNPVFADIDLQTFNLSPKSIEQKITSKTSAIVPVHVFGNCCEVDEINEIAQQNNLKVIYDAAHSFGVKYKETSILKSGNISTLSFHATKVFHTIEGGALIINDPDLYARARKMIDFGIDGPDRISQLGINAKMNEFQAAMGLCVLDDMDIILGKRKEVYERYREAFTFENKVTLQKHNESGSHNFSYFPIILEDELTLLRVKEALNENNVNPRRYFYPSLNKVEFFGVKDEMPNAQTLSERILCLPLFDSLDKSAQMMIIQIIKKALL
jgi:dTDP-4-amino-4,6-dideoxygalactose transaminase